MPSETIELVPHYYEARLWLDAPQVRSTRYAAFEMLRRLPAGEAAP